MSIGLLVSLYKFYRYFAMMSVEEGLRVLIAAGCSKVKSTFYKPADSISDVCRGV